MDNKTVGITAIAGVGLVFAAIKISNLKKAGDKIVLHTKPTVSKGTVYVEVRVQNPTSTSLKVSHPFVRVFKSEEDMAKNEPLISTTIENRQHTIKGNEETKFRIRIGTIEDILLALAKSIFSILKNALQKGSREQKVFIHTELRVNERIPYSKLDEFTIIKPKQNV
ncbi:hypothetical protein WAF17_10780 [Bernardetia sp. ABR2-2B]|uniref:hypothetical protein n=1 Tax=Bernardetia sp. ABR2-2B TaxID=3127472 RepID=UPI0030CFDE2A